MSSNDEKLDPLLRAREGEVQREIERLVMQLARPLAGAILSRYSPSQKGMSQQDLDDIGGTVQLRLVAKLRDLAAGAGESIQNFDNYVATLTYNAINDHLRKMYPERTRLKNRLRYALRNDPRLATWSSAGRIVCGLSAWEGEATPLQRSALDDRALPPEQLDQERIGDALAALFGAAGAPVTLDELVELTARMWHIVDLPDGDIDTAAATAETTASRFEMREYLRALWREIRELRPMQRKALLLNLRSEESVNVISLLVLTGIAAFDEVAAALEMPAEELAALWNDLPLDDLHIASMLQVTRQQVINLRKSGRERLSRRMGR